MMALLDLPNEILILVADRLSPRGFSSLLRTNRQLNTLLAPVLLSYVLRGINDEWVEGTEPPEAYDKLFWAASRGHEQLVKLLLETGLINVNARTSKYSTTGFIVRGPRKHTVTALHLAAVQGNVGVIRLLLDNGAEIDQRESSRGQTALLLAVDNTQEVAARLLVERGADVTARADCRQTALDSAILGGKDELAEFLLGKGARSRYMCLYKSKELPTKYELLFSRVNKVIELEPWPSTKLRIPEEGQESGLIYGLNKCLSTAMQMVLRIGKRR